jgi:hypothetical protein
MEGLLAPLPENKLMANEVASPNTRRGLFKRLDHRISYIRGMFPEPFLIDDTDLESNEVPLVVHPLMLISGSDSTPLPLWR